MGQELASGTDTNSDAFGSVFLLRGLGYLFGSIISGKLLEVWCGHRVSGVCLLLAAVLMSTVPFVTNFGVMHLVFCLLGMRSVRPALWNVVPCS